MSSHPGHKLDDNRALQSRQILRRVGWVLTLTGLLDVGIMIYCIMNQISYSSSLNIFAVIAGVLLIRGSLGAARFVTSGSAFLVTGLTLALLIFPWLVPWKYTWLMFRNDPLSWAGSHLFGIVLLLMLAWVYRQLRSPAVVETLAAAGRPSQPPFVAVAVAIVLVLSLGVLFKFTLNDAAREAIRRAQEQYGSEYDYFVSRINTHPGGGSATVVAYSDRDMREIEIEWSSDK